MELKVAKELIHIRGWLATAASISARVPDQRPRKATGRSIIEHYFADFPLIYDSAAIARLRGSGAV